MVWSLMAPMMTASVHVLLMAQLCSAPLDHSNTITSMLKAYTHPHPLAQSDIDRCRVQSLSRSLD